MARDDARLPLVNHRYESLHARPPPFKWRYVLTTSAWVLLGCTLGVIGLSAVTPAASTMERLETRNALRTLPAQPNDPVDLSACSQIKRSTTDSDSEPPTHKRVKRGTDWFLSSLDDPELVVSAIPSIKSTHELPRHWDWRNYNGTGISLVTSIQNQMVPKPCGSCWAFATTSAVSDRIRIAQYLKYGTVGPEVLLSPQVLLDCGMLSFGSCEGGDPRFAHKWIHENGIVDTTCNPYIAAHPSWFGATASCAATQCRRCLLNGECHVLHDPKKYFISEYGTLNASTLGEFELEAMSEIYHRGPIVVSMFSHAPAYVNYNGTFILRDFTDYGRTTHVVSLIGWGVDDDTNVKYWIVRNSDGTNWGDNGFFRVERGNNTYMIESHGAWAVPMV